LLLMLFVAGAFLFVVLLLRGAGDLVSLSPRLSVFLSYFLYFYLFAVIATTLLEVISDWPLAVCPKRCARQD
jgi:hypothetical protein